MKRLLLALALAGAGLHADERILNFESQIAVQRTGRIDVTEKITVRSEGREIRRGIYRDLPTLYAHPSFKGVPREIIGWHSPVKMLAVLRGGHPEPWFTRGMENGLRTYAGKSDVFLDNGVYVYTFQYRYDRILKRLPEHDELYWNVTGNGWTFPIDAVTAVVTLPGAPGGLRMEAYTGRQGEKGRDWKAEPLDEGRALYTSTRPLKAYEGFTLVLGWPKGLTPAPALWRRAWWAALDYGPAAAAIVSVLLLFVALLIAWMRHGVDPPMRPVVPRFYPPKGLPPAALRWLDGQGKDDISLAATLIHAAVDGHLRIEADPKKRRHWILRRAHRGGEPGPLQAAALQVFGGRESVRTADEDDGARFRAGKAALDKAVEAHWKLDFERNLGLFWRLAGLAALLLLPASLLGAGTAMPRLFAFFACAFLMMLSLGAGAAFAAALDGFRPGRLGVYWPEVLGLGFAGLFAGGFSAGLFGVLAFANGAFWPALQALLSGLLLGAFAVWLGRPSSSLQALRDEIQGFTLYLGTAERRRLDYLRPPEDTPQLFEKYLPYAVALGVANQWAERFKTVLAKASAQGHALLWAGDSGAFRSRDLGSFSRSFSGSFSSAISSASTPPSSGGSGFSGGGGGGSSGGGGGGGGGGGW